MLQIFENSVKRFSVFLGIRIAGFQGEEFEGLQQKYWLMKTEPETFSWQDLLQRPKQTEHWEGVRNYQARNFMRDHFGIGDLAFIYHSSTDNPAIMGVAKVVGTAYPDPTALDPESPYFDALSASQGESRWCMVDVQAVASFQQPISLKALRLVPELGQMALLQKGQRLSIQPVTQSEWSCICQLGSLQE